ncbi:hypothetical protein [Streptomyces sp. NPDC047000]|uniref:hypothetical protein n=1 Tax=Streptomyces sp. NPDC047000 TaxID=3155474 RepID=UPI003410E3A3
MRRTTKPKSKDVFGGLTVRATEAIVADPRQAAGDFVWYRTGWEEIQYRRDGITIDWSDFTGSGRVVPRVPGG